MWRNYLTVAIRSLTKNRVYSAINVFGLAIGMAACLIILLYVRYEHSYDAWLPDAENIYQVQTHYKDPNLGGHLQSAAYAAKAPLLKDYPQIEATVFLNAGDTRIIKDGATYKVPDAVFTDSNPFAVLRLPLIRGNRGTALNEVNTAVLSETEAKRWFGDTDPIGKVLKIPWAKSTKDFRVTGVMRDLPQNSHMKISMLLRWNFEAAFEKNDPAMITRFERTSGLLYFRTKSGADIKAMAAGLAAWEKRNIPDMEVGGKTVNLGDLMDLAFVNVRDVHLSAAEGWTGKPTNSESAINTFAIIAIMILAIGCVNFVNLATARASQRAREVALRKVLGANRTQLVVQFIGESLLMAAIAMLFALALAELTLPSLNSFLEVDMRMLYWSTGGMALPILALVLIVGTAGGIYPGIYLSRFHPAHVLKANKSAADAQSSGKLRSALVIGQFAVSIGLLICTAVVYSQMIYARTADIGLKREGLLQVRDLNSIEYFHNSSEALKQQIGKVSGVVSVGAGTINLGSTIKSNNIASIPGRTGNGTIVGDYEVDDGFFRTMGIRLLAGRVFDRNRSTDDSSIPSEPAMQALVNRGKAVVINERAASTMGFTSPGAAIGKQIKMGFGINNEIIIPATVIGVVQNSRFRSLHDPLDPTIFSYNSRFQNTLVIRYSGNPTVIRDKVEQVWKRFASDIPFEAEFSEDIVARQYQAEESRAAVFATFSILAVLIGCLGLFGLASFTTERRTKEIGIRKVLGASTQRIVRLLVWQFSRPVLIANLIAWPVAWWVMRDWLNTFDARIALTPVPFVAAGLIALAIAVGTIAAHSIRVARSNPIHALRYE